MKSKEGIKVFWAVLVLTIIFGCATAANQLNTVEPDMVRFKLDATDEQGDWDWTRRQNTIIAYKFFLARYPKGAKIKEANSELEKLYYKRISAGDDLSAYVDFLKRYPNSVYKDSAWSQTEAPLFKQAKKINTAKAYEDFLKNFPHSVYASEAKALIGKLKEAADKEREQLDKLMEIRKGLAK